jgi:5-methyltetrahydrofolate--homocysteine methyltransferase
MLDEITASGALKANGVAGIFPANSVNNEDIVLYSDEMRKSKALTINCLRQQAEKTVEKPYLSLADFVAPQESGNADFAGCFAVTAGIGLDAIVNEYESHKDDFGAIMAKILADRLAEAFAEKLHSKVRRDLWGYAADESFESKELFRVKYRGIRPAPGYPACPDHEAKRGLFDLLDVTKNCGISLTESAVMVPVASVCGYYFAHPQASYFGLTAVGKDQIESYSKRLGQSKEAVEKRLATILGYKKLEA